VTSSWPDRRCLVQISIPNFFCEFVKSYWKCANKVKIRNFTWEMNSIGSIIHCWNAGNVWCAWNWELEPCGFVYELSKKCQLYPTHTVATLIFVHSRQIYPQLFWITQYVFRFWLQDRCSSKQSDWFDSQFCNQLLNDICARSVINWNRNKTTTFVKQHKSKSKCNFILI
jgi:hypothetical protein